MAGMPKGGATSKAGKAVKKSPAPMKAAGKGGKKK